MSRLGNLFIEFSLKFRNNYIFFNISTRSVLYTTIIHYKYKCGFELKAIINIEKTSQDPPFVTSVTFFFTFCDPYHIFSMLIREIMDINSS